VEALGLPGEVYAAGLVFVRVAAVVMLLPGVGESAVPPRIRLAFAFILSLTLTPIVAASLPAVPATAGAMGGQVIGEALIGLMIGALLRLFLTSLAVAGEVISLQTTLSFAQISNPTQAQPTAALAAFLTLMGVLLIFSADLHHVFIAAIARSYVIFAPGQPVPLGDAATLAGRTLGEAFALGLQLAGPVVVFSLVVNVAAGLIGRVMPQFQVFFAATPIMVLGGLAVFALSLGVLGLVWIERYEAFARRFSGT
jgi:flagellar biosynthetic protein FliR